MAQPIETDAERQMKAVKGCAGCTGVIIGLLAIGVCIPAAIDDAERRERIDDAMENDPDYALHAQALLREAFENTYAADKRYDDRVVQVTGTVLSKSLGKLSQIVYLGPEVQKNMSIWCYFDEEWNSRLAELRRGDTIKVRGVVQVGLGGSVFIHECKLVGRN